ncbi:hypothetical protein [Bartonella doshiae]|uniref:hypothetical protein n=1 Tax=Bartonella doshiae TaxID=33044 RepID=UPI001ABA8BF2|nr:hypothetical protein [Bartonella doshiae]
MVNRKLLPFEAKLFGEVLGEGIGTCAWRVLGGMGEDFWASVLANGVVRCA